MLTVLQVIARIFYTVSKSWNFKITLSELRKSNFLEVSISVCVCVCVCVCVWYVPLCVSVDINNKEFQVFLCC